MRGWSVFERRRAGLNEGLARPPGREDGDVSLRQGLGERDQAGLVGDGQKRAGDAAKILRHSCSLAAA